MDRPSQPRTGHADALVVVDMQKGFLHRQAGLVHAVHTLTQAYPDHSTYWLVYRNYPNSPFVRHLGWGQMMSSPDIDIADTLTPDPSRTFRHESYSLPRELKNALKGCQTVALAGTDTDACIQGAAFDLWHEGIQPLVIEPCCGSSGGIHFHRSAIDLMRRQFGVQAIVDTITPGSTGPRPQAGRTAPGPK